MRDYDFSRQIKVAALGEKGQEALKNARVLLAGAGGLGATAISYLAAAGIGHLTIVDDDRVEVSNLHRQILFTYQDIGKEKAKIAAQFSQNRSPYGTFTAICRRLSPAEWLKEMEEHDVIVDCTDDRVLPYLLSDAALLTGKPVVFANVAALNGQLFTMQPSEENPCWRCLWPEDMQPAGESKAIGVLPPVPATLGAWQALTVIKLLAGLPVGSGEMLYYDFLTMRQQAIKVNKNPLCYCSLPVNKSLFITCHTKSYLYSESLAYAQAEGIVIIDIRRPQEWELRPLPEANLQVEMQILLQNPTQFIQPQHRYLLVCATGKRAQYTAQQLRQQGLVNVEAFPQAW